MGAEVVGSQALQSALPKPKEALLPEPKEREGVRQRLLAAAQHAAPPPAMRGRGA
jgi:hypothetical protein